MLLIFSLIVIILVFGLIRRSQEKRNPEKFAEQKAQRAERLALRKAKNKRRMDALKREMLLGYAGGHPSMPRRGQCRLIRSEDGQTVEMRIGKESVTIPTKSITRVTLVPHSEVQTKQKSGVGGAIVGELVGGTFGAIVGGMATRKKISKTLHQDIAVVTIKHDGSEIQLMFRWIGNKPSSKWYPRAASILSPALEA